MDQPNNRIERWSKIAAFVATLATILSGLSAFQVSRFETKLKEVQAERELNFRIYTSIADALESGDPKRVMAVRGIVEAMASDNIKPKFLEALEPAIVSVYEEEQLALIETRPIDESVDDEDTASPEALPDEEVEAPTPGPTPAVAEGTTSIPWGDWDFDIFWCAGGGLNAENDANKIRAWLQRDGAQGRIRTRILPSSINQQAGYKVKGYEIRRSTEEAGMANRLETFLRNIEGVGKYPWVQRTTTQNTPWYISVFICPQTRE